MAHLKLHKLSSRADAFEPDFVMLHIRPGQAYRDPKISGLEFLIRELDAVVLKGFFYIRQL